MTLTNLVIFALVGLCNAFAIIGFNRSCFYDEDGKMILWKVRYYGDLLVSEFWRKPLYDCTTCMASVHGALPYWITCMMLYDFNIMAVVGWVFYTITLAGIVNKMES